VVGLLKPDPTPYKAPQPFITEECIVTRKVVTSNLINGEPNDQARKRTYRLNDREFLLPLGGSGMASSNHGPRLRGGAPARTHAEEKHKKSRQAQFLRHSRKPRRVPALGRGLT